MFASLLILEGFLIDMHSDTKFEGQLILENSSIPCIRPSEICLCCTNEFF